MRLVLLFTSVGLWRQQLRPEAGSTASSSKAVRQPTSSPTAPSGGSCCAAPTRPSSRRMQVRFRSMVEAAAMASGTDGDVVYSGASSTMRDNTVLGERFRANMTAQGIEDQGPDSSTAAPTWATSARSCRPSTRTWPSARTASRATPSGFPRRGDHAARRRDHADRRHPGRADGLRPVRRPRARRGRLAGVPWRLTKPRRRPQRRPYRRPPSVQLMTH